MKSRNHHGSRVAKRPIKIRKEKRTKRALSCSDELCGVRVIPAVDVAVVQVKAACRCWAWGSGGDGAGGNSGKPHGGWQTAGVVLVADALGTWLVEQLADAGRKKLTELMLGCEQERALRRAADAAVWATAEEMSPSGGERAGQVAMVISEVFRDPAPDAPLAGPVMLLESLRARIAGQLAVLDDAALTGTGQSSAEVLGVVGTVLADRLTGHLVREIIVRGSGGGPLTLLADQFNHELTRLQGQLLGQRIEGMLARLAEEVRDALARPGSSATTAGRPLEEVTDPFVLEVHRPCSLRTRRWGCRSCRRTSPPGKHLPAGGPVPGRAERTARRPPPRLIVIVRR